MKQNMVQLSEAIAADTATIALVDNLLWAARELAAGRELAVEGANYLCDAQDWLNAQKGAA